MVMLSGRKSGMFRGGLLQACGLLAWRGLPANVMGSFGPVSVTKLVMRGGRGTREAMVCFSSIDLQEKSLDGGGVNICSPGPNWELTSIMSLSVNCCHIVLDQVGEIG